MLPRVFFGSSSEGLEYARAIVQCLDQEFEVTVWDKDGLFEPSKFTLESLLAFTARFDYGIFVMTADDLATIRDKNFSIARDNVVFEAGLFIGALGRTNCFLFVSDAKELHVPTDLQGLTEMRFSENRGALAAQLLPLMKGPCSKLIKHCKQSDHWGMNGKWRQTWFVTKTANFPMKNTSTAEVAVFGSRFRAKFDVNGTPYELVARINEDRTVTGFWSRTLKTSYHGSCQLAISPGSTSLSGKWVGFRSNNQVESGRWEWSRA